MFDFLKRPGSGTRPQQPTPASGLAELYTAKAQEEAEMQSETYRRIHLQFSGQVQGVGFRWNARTCAEDVGCTGWVQNEWDGSVTMELQGTYDQIARFFTLFNEQYRVFRISYTIDEKEDIPTIAGEESFVVLL
jgi:acylphosphatase